MLKVGACTSGMDLGFEQFVTTEKVAWLSQRSQPHWGVKYLVRYLQEEKYVIYPISRSKLRSTNLQDYQIFLIEAKDRLDATLLEMTLELRVQTLALIVILMEEPTSAEIVQLLGNGADAVWTTTEPAQVLRARTRSLLRRFKGFNMKV